MSQAGPTDEPPSADELRRTLAEQTPLLADPALSDVLRVRVQRSLDTVADLLDLGDGAREPAALAVAWLAEAAGEYLRLPTDFAHGHAVAGKLAPLLTLVDRLDLLGLTLDHTYDAVHRDDAAALERQIAVLAGTFAARSDARDLVETAISPEHLDEDVVREHGLEVGDDGVPRMPVPEPPDPQHAPGSSDSGQPDPDQPEQETP